MRHLTIVLLCSSSASAADFVFKDARAALVLTAQRPQADSTTWVTCAGVVVDKGKRWVVVPLQCVPNRAATVACRSATDVALGRQLRGKDFQHWQQEKNTCRVLTVSAKYNLALVRADNSFSKEVRSVEPAAVPTMGSQVWSIGFPAQIPALLARGYVAAVLDEVNVSDLPSGFKSRLIVVSGPSSPGSAGSGVFDNKGRLVGIMIADANHIDGGFVVPAAQLRHFLQSVGE